MNKTKLLRLVGRASVLLLATALPAGAHPGHGAMSGLAAGIQHPLSGLDHLLAMVAVGLWAGLCGGRREWLWPATFVVSMVGGAAIGMFTTIHLVIAEPAILASVMVLGLATALSLRAPLALGGMVIAVFGLAHGYAHGTEMPHTPNGLDFALGFTMATAALHLMGLTAAIGLRRRRLDVVTRAAGVGIAIAGLGLVMGV